MKFLYRQLAEELFKGQNAGDKISISTISKDFAAGSEVQEASELQLTSPQVNTNPLIKMSLNQICYFLCR